MSVKETGLHTAEEALFELTFLCNAQQAKQVTIRLCIYSADGGIVFHPVKIVRVGITYVDLRAWCGVQV